MESHLKQVAASDHVGSAETGSPADTTAAVPEHESFSATKDEEHNVNDASDGEDGAYVINASDMKAEDLASKKRKKPKKRKPASKRGLDKPTGFEDNFADAPMTPEQYAELKEIYSPDLPFVERILKAIQRFERTRKLTPERRDIFYKYLAYGGIDVGPNMFQGGQEVKDLDKDEVVTAMAHANITEEAKANIHDPKQSQQPNLAQISKTLAEEHQAKYVVDFEITVRAFLSRRAQTMFGFETQARVELVTNTLERFMDYLMQNEVCPEYAGEVLSARNLCRQARNDLWHCAEAQRILPGDFNIACSTLFGGMYGRNYDGSTCWGPTQSGENVFVGLTEETASQIMGFAIAGAATEEVYKAYHEIKQSIESGTGKEFSVDSTIRGHGFEITHIETPSKDCRDLYERNTNEFKPVGCVRAYFWKNPDAPPQDLLPEEKNASISKTLTADLYQYEARQEHFTFFVEDPTLLPLLRVGQKIEATMYQLNCGIWFFDEVIRVLPPFEAWIENELVLGWKEPKPLKGSLGDAQGAIVENGEGQ